MELVPGRRRNGGGYQSPSSREDDPADEHHPSQLELESSNIRRAAAAATTTALDLLPSSSTAVVGVGLSVPGHPPPSTSSSASSSPTASGAAEAGPDPTAAQAQPQQPPAAAVEKEHMFDKVVTPSDVGKLNRLVIPKQHAERYFPLDPTANERGLLLSFEDRDGKSWRFRYSYWNSSQSYVMTKGWSRFVKDKRLDAGDTVSFSRAAEGAGPRDRLFIDWKRRPQPPPPPSLPHHLLQQYFYDHHHHHHQLSSYMGRPAQSGSNFFLPPFSSGANYSSMVSFARGSSNPPPPAAATAAWSRLFAPSIGPPPSAYPSTSTIPYDDNYSNSYYQQLHRRNSYGHNAANPHLYMRPPSGSSGVPSPTASSSQLYGGVPQMEYYSSGSSMSGMLAGSSSSSINAGWVVDRHQAIVSDPPPVSEQENSPIVAAAASKRVRLFGVNLNDDSERELVEGVRLHPFAGYPPQLGSSQMQQVRPMLPPFLPLQLSLGSPGGVSSSSAVNDATRVESPGRDDEHNPMSLDLDD